MLALISPVFAQSINEGVLRGNVSDSAGALIPRARLTLTDVATNVAHNAVSDAKGGYSFRALPPATYKMLIEADGFGPVEQDNITLTVNQQATLNVTLRPATVTESVTVSTVPVLLDSEDATLGTDVGSKYLVQIPLVGRDSFGLTFLAGGVTETTGSGVADSYPAGTNFVSNGQRNATAEIRLDGNLTSAPEQGEGGTSNVYYQPSVEALQEFKVENNSFSAEYGNNGGTIVNTVMKSGTNTLHGSAWWYGQRSVFDARDFFNSGPVPDHQHDQYGFSLGGPVRKDRTFFFVDMEITRDRSPVNITATVPTAAERTGDFSNTMSYDVNGNLVQNQIFDPFFTQPDGSRPAYANNTIPQGEIDPVGQQILNYYPKADLPGDPGIGTNNYRNVILSGGNNIQFDAKLDQNFSSRSRINARYSYLHNNGSTPSLFFDDIFNDGDFYTTDVYNDGLEYTFTPTPNTLWVSHFGIDRVASPSFSKTPDPTSFGFPSSLDQNGISRMPAILPNSNGDYSRFTPLFSQCCVDTKFAHTLLNYSSSFTWTPGKHSIKFGGEQRLFYNNFFQPNYPTGYFSFDPLVTAGTPYDTDNGTQGNSFANILIGYGDTGGINVSRAVADLSRETAFYVQDDWKITEKLTLNLGLRYEWSTPYTERHNLEQFSDFTAQSGMSVPTLGPILGSTVFASNSQRNIPVDRNNIAPRFGFAYAVSEKTVVRGGAGIYYGMNVATNYQYPGPAFSSSPSVFFTKNNYVTRYATLENPFPAGIEDPQGTKYGKLAEWGLGNGNNLDYEKARNAEIYQWNLGVQQAFPGKIVIGIDYSASRSTHLPWGGYSSTSNRNFIASSVRRQYTSDELANLVTNPFQPYFSGTSAIFNEPESRYGDDQIPQINLLRPYPQFDGSFQGLPKLAAQTWYNSLQVRFQKRAGSYLSFEGNYTWSKAEDNSSTGFNAFVGNLDSGNPQELDNLKAEWSVSANDATNRLAGAVVTQLPVGRGRLIGSNMSRWLDTIAGGWQGSTLFTYQTGQPMPISMSSPRIADGNQRPDVVCSQVLTGISVHRAAFTDQPYLNQNCFADPGDQQPGNAPRYFSNIRADSIHNFDVSFMKSISLPRESNLEIHADFFNFTNTPRFAFPAYDYEDSAFGIVSSTAAGYTPRHTQFGVRYQF
ncbi:TonB-dependent receptor [Acidipila sp. 4G-K13]|uniref:TonB-dependent transporter Oar-like beta-barrel domain-containing protein n=2 Tax=Paracidobacterium acidisoli TaxID=2303751 RepID=A0A372IV10_9BACT|nr:TonB-dependent receptor [Paracidobacterium acidisoli]